MKQLSFNQIQFRVLAAIFLFFSLTVVGYRLYVERPILEENLITLAEQEISTLFYSATKMLETFDLEARDYAVWNVTYDFMRKKNDSYIDDNLNDDTFANLRVDGFYLIDENYKTVIGKSLRYKTKALLNFEFNNFDLFPDNKKMFPVPTTEYGAPIKNGILMTNAGIAIYSAVQVRSTNVTGEHRGYVVFIRLVDQDIFDEFSRYTMTKITFEGINNGQVPTGAVELGNNININSVRQYSQVFLRDINNKPTLLLTVKHSSGEMPPLLNVNDVMFMSGVMMVIVLIYYMISTLIINPVISLANEIKKMESGKVVRLDKQHKIKELTQIADNFNLLVDDVVQHTQLLSTHAYIDSLTGIQNRRAFEDHFAKQAQLCIRKNIGFVLIMADVDHFKKFNDTSGHIEGDKALVKVAQTLKKHFRRESEICARYGGEEFIMLYSDISEQFLIEKLNDIISAFKFLNLPHPDPDTVSYLTLSLGACMVYPDQINNYSLPFERVVQQADIALYQAKDEGRNRAVICKFHGSVEDKKSP